MKKTYIRPETTLIRFHIESSVLMNVSDATRQSDDWSNEREWSGDRGSLWGDAETDAER